METDGLFDYLMEEYKPFPKDKVNRQIDKKKAEGNPGDARILRAVSNYKTRATDFKKADQKFVGKDKQKALARRQKHAADAARNWEKADKHEAKAEKHEKKGNKKKQEKQEAKADKCGYAGNRACNRGNAMNAVHKAYARATPKDDKKQEEVNKKSKEDRAKVKSMAKRADLEKAFNKPAVSGAEKGFKKESLNFTEFCDEFRDPLYEVKGSLPKCPPGYRFDKKQMQCVPKTDKDDVRVNGKGAKDSHPSNGPSFGVWGSTGINGDGYAWAEKNDWGGSSSDGPEAVPYGS